MKNIIEKDKETAEIAALKNRINELETLVSFYEEQFRLSKHRQFGASSEKSEYDGDQLNLFNEAEVAADEKAVEPELVEVEKHYRKARRSSGDRLPSDIPVEVVEHELPAEEQVCTDCGGSMHVMGRESRRELKIIPAKVKVVEHRQSVYSCRHCENHSDHTPILREKLRSNLSLSPDAGTGHKRQFCFARSCRSCHGTISEPALIEIIRQDMQRQLERVSVDESKVVGEIQKRFLVVSLEKTQTEQLRLSARLEELDAQAASLYEDRLTGAINLDTFKELSVIADADRVETQAEYERLSENLETAERQIFDINSWIKGIRSCLAMNAPDFDTLHELISKIEVEEAEGAGKKRRQAVKIFYRFVGFMG